MRFRIFGADHPMLYQFAHVGMIVGDSRDLAISYEIKPAVANVSKVELTCQDHNRGAGRTHVAQRGMFLRMLPNSAMSFLERLHQSGPGVANRRRGVDFFNCFNCYAAGFLSAFVSTHTIRDNGETPLELEFLVIRRLPVGVTILIILALAAYIRETRQLDSRTNLHHHLQPFLLFMQTYFRSFL